MLEKGFSLVELLTVLLIVVVLTAIAVPLFTDFNQEHRLTTVSENLYYFLQQARSEAVKNNTTVYVSFQTGSSWCYGANAGSACTCNVAGSCSLGTTNASTAQDISLSTSGLSGNSVTFDGTRAATNASSTITFTLSSKAITAKISALGNIQLCSADISGYATCT